jgi:hypothetical protein
LECSTQLHAITCYQSIFYEESNKQHLKYQMKKQLISLGLIVAAITSANAAITFSGNAAATLRDKDGVALGLKYAMLIVDTTGVGNNASNGFLTNSTDGANWYTSGSATGLTATADPGVLPENASITSGGYFGGDRILAIGTTTASGNLAFSGGIDITDYQNKNFAIVWFSKDAAELALGVTGAYYGIAAGSDWVFPGTPNQTASFSPSSFSTATAYAQLGAAPTTAQLATLGFFTGSGIAGDALTPGSKNAVFQLGTVAVPEPSAALLGALGALGLLRRRRI